MSTNFGERLRQLRGAAGLDLESLAGGARLKLTTVTSLEEGDNLPTYSQVESLARACGHGMDVTRALWDLAKLDRHLDGATPQGRAAEAQATKIRNLCRQACEDTGLDAEYTEAMCERIYKLAMKDCLID